MHNEKRKRVIRRYKSSMELTVFEYKYLSINKAFALELELVKLMINSKKGYALIGKKSEKVRLSLTIRYNALL